MEKNIEVSLLLDFYGELLKPGVRQTIDLYYNDDLSLSEVAAQCGITRQGVRDSIKRGETQLYEFEQKLGLWKRFREVEAGLDEIEAAAAEIPAKMAKCLPLTPDEAETLGGILWKIMEM